MTTLQIVGLVATSLTILSIIIGVAVRLAAFPSERKISSLEIENNQLRHKLDQIVENQSKLVESLTLLKTTSSDIQTAKGEIDQELKYLAQMLGVNSASVLVPYPLSNNTRFAFLSIAGPEADKLKNFLLDIKKGIAGQVYADGQPKIISNPKANHNWSATVDNRMAFETQNLLCLPMKYGNSTIGVVQFLNKPESFTEHDQIMMEKAIATLVFKVGKFVQRIENFEILGLAYSQDSDDGTVIFTDISSSSSLLKGAHPRPTLDVVNLINEYLEKTTMIAIGNGCIVDKFMWDGCLMSLNVAKSIPDHRIVAYRTALSMANQFNELKKSWIRAEYPAERMFLRVAIASGPIKQVDMGPAQYRQKTIVGDPVVAASALCANSPRDRNIITVEQSVYDAIISDHIKATKISPREMGKAKDLVISAYQIALANQ